MYLLKDFWPIGQKVAQFNAKFQLMLNWTLLCLFDFMIIAQIIVRFIMYLTNMHVINMLVMKNTAKQMKANEKVFVYFNLMHRQKFASVGQTCVF